MNQPQSYLEMHPGSHMSSGPSYSHQATAGSIPHYPQYQQTSAMPPGSAHYAPGPTYGNYAYGNPVTSPQSAGPLPSMMPGASAQHYAPPNGAPVPYANPQVPFDTSGQIAPPGMKPRVTATLWEDEGSLCFQVEAKGVCVARREDNHYINGTKLLNVAGMTRGRRDGILKSEKMRSVVKIGPMHLKGVWIPYERALEFANKEKITDLLYPLFVHNIGNLLYQPENGPRNVVQTSELRRAETTESTRSGQGSQTPSLRHHHSMQNGTTTQIPPTPQSVGPAGRPSLDRAHTFPTPPTSASSVLGMANQASYDWNSQSLPSNVNGSAPLSIDTGLNARSMPTTPATTPPGSNVQGSNPYQSHQQYESKQYYATTPSSQGGYQQQSNRFDTFSKSDMGPPTAPSSGPAEPHEHKTEPYSADHPSQSDSNEHSQHGYMTSNQNAYSRNSYAYNATNDHQHLSSEISGSPSHQTASGRGTPRTMPSSQPQWQTEFHTPPRSSTSGHMYNVVGDNRGSGGSTYPASSYSTTGKRGRDDDDDDKHDGYKRQKMGRADTFGMPLTPNVHMQAIKSGGGLPGQR